MACGALCRASGSGQGYPQSGQRPELTSRRAFVEMVSRADYQAVAMHRTAALADSRLIMTVPAALPL